MDVQSEDFADVEAYVAAVVVAARNRLNQASDTELAALDDLLGTS